MKSFLDQKCAFLDGMPRHQTCEILLLVLVLVLVLSGCPVAHSITSCMALTTGSL
jgi:hypothetical protein